jgi:hypothetical protein
VLDGEEGGMRDDRGSLPFALLLTLMSVSATSLLLPVVVNEFQATRLEIQRDDAVNAAQAGLDVALAHLRASRDLDGDDDSELGELPCGSLAGAVSSAPGAATYEVTITYWLPDGTQTTGCPAATPASARLRSTGTDDGVVRVLRATYTMQTNNQNIGGGLVRVFHPASATNDLCLDAGSGNPANNTAVRMQVCDANSVAQRFVYTTSLTLKLVSSVTTGNPNGMCLYAATPQALADIVRFQACATPVPARQMWSMNGSANFEGTNNGSDLNGNCFNVQSPDVPGSLVILGRSPNCFGGYNNRQSFSPDASVGAGAAGIGNRQLVNYNQFGRCLDVTEGNVNYSYMISWPCKQEPNPANLDWNQLWQTPAVSVDANGVERSSPGLITTTSSSRYCLRSPGSTTAGAYVTVTSCPSATSQAALQWTVYRATGDYTTAYRIIDSWGNCLAATDQQDTPPDLYPNGNLISKIVVRACTSSTLQKWNAPPGLAEDIPVKDIYEE